MQTSVHLLTNVSHTEVVFISRPQIAAGRCCMCKTAVYVETQATGRNMSKVKTMVWIKVKDGYVNDEAVEAIMCSAYTYEDKHRVVLSTHGGNTYVYKEVDTKEECIKEVDKLVSELLDWEI